VLSAKAGLADFKQWYRKAFGRHSPWGSQNSKAFVTAVESALERELSTHIMRGGEKPKFHNLKAGALLTEQGAGDNEVFLVLDGVVMVEVNGEPLAEYGPGAILGERAALEGGPRTATLRAVTKVRVAAVGADQLDRHALAQVAEGHRREDARES
jgi:CRP-like cAMP-binding protein